MKKENLKAKVEEILSTFPDTRNQDTLLSLQVWHSLRSDLFLSLDGRDRIFAYFTAILRKEDLSEFSDVVEWLRERMSKIVIKY